MSHGPWLMRRRHDARTCNSFRHSFNIPSSFLHHSFISHFTQYFLFSSSYFLCSLRLLTNEIFVSELLFCLCAQVLSLPTLERIFDRPSTVVFRVVTFVWAYRLDISSALTLLLYYKNLTIIKLSSWEGST